MLSGEFNARAGGKVELAELRELHLLPAAGGVVFSTAVGEIGCSKESAVGKLQFSASYLLRSIRLASCHQLQLPSAFLKSWNLPCQVNAPAYGGAVFRALLPAGHPGFGKVGN